MEGVLPRVAIHRLRSNLPHSWASAIAQDLVPPDTDAGRQLRLALTQVLTPVFREVPETSIDALADDAVQRVRATFQSSPWGDYYSEDERVSDLADMVSRHLRSAKMQYQQEVGGR